MAFGLKVPSKLPSVLSLAIRLRHTPQIVVKVHPMRIFPSVWIFIARIWLHTIATLNVVSRVPSVLSLAIRLRHTPQIVVKVHPMRIFPSDCMAVA